MMKTASLGDVSSASKQRYTKNIRAVRSIFGATAYMILELNILTLAFEFLFENMLHIWILRDCF
jgi:hypothetical protein